jgi:VanZ family protein
MSKKYIYVALACIYAGMIFWLSSLSFPPNPLRPVILLHLYEMLKSAGVEFLAYPFYVAYRYPDKFVHTLLYMGFGFVLNPAVRNTLNRHPEATSIIVGTIYGASDEFHQMFVPHRSASLADLAADFVGLVISQIIVLAVIRLRRWWDNG